jgi:hypothetical protein
MNTETVVTTEAQATTKKARSKSVFANSKEFVLAYLSAQKSGKTLNDFASDSGMRPLSLRSRIALMKKRGVNLPPLKKDTSAGKRGRQQLDIDELNALIAGM